ncbi:MAG TPA: hypothetical protein VHE61_13575 [Opitutaceae bacterium]|nr:hypothetical protein [Opitutaceae bacterium]
MAKLQSNSRALPVAGHSVESFETAIVRLEQPAQYAASTPDAKA